MDRPRIKFYLDKRSFTVHSASLLLILAAAFQIVGSWGLWNDRFIAFTQILLPTVSFLLMVLIVSLLGEKALWLSAIPFLGGLAFCGISAWFDENRVAMMIGIVVCVLALVLYLGTVFSLIRTKWLLVLLFAAAFLYRAFYRDVILLQQTDSPMGFADGMREMSLLCVLLAMMLVSFGMKKRMKERKRREPDIPPASPDVSEPEPTPVSEPLPVQTSVQESEQTPGQVAAPEEEAAPADAEEQKPAESDS